MAKTLPVETGLCLLRRGEFMLAHECFEEAWRQRQEQTEQQRTLLHALAQMAAAHHQLSLGRARAALSTSNKACAKLESIGMLDAAYKAELGAFYAALGIVADGERFVALAALPPSTTWPCPSYLSAAATRGPQASTLHDCQAAPPGTRAPATLAAADNPSVIHPEHSVNAIANWHAIVSTKDVGALDSLLAEDVTFHSPVVHTPQRGRAITKMYLSAALAVFVNDSFRYVREVVGERMAVLEFVTEISGIQVNGVDMIEWDTEGRICDFKVMVRPLKAIQLIHQMMAAQLPKA